MGKILTVLLALAVDYFTRHQTSDECHITSDQRVFHTKGAADSFANSLEDKTVVSYTRNEALSNIEVKDPEDLSDDEDNKDDEDDKDLGLDETSKDLAASAADTTGSSILKLSDFDPEKTDWPTALELFKTLNLKAPSHKKKDIFPVLVAEKAKLETNTQE